MQFDCFQNLRTVLHVNGAMPLLHWARWVWAKMMSSESRKPFQVQLHWYKDANFQSWWESVSAIYVESARAIARKTSIGEEIFEEAAKKGVKIICGDHPTLFKSPASPIESFIRKVMFAMNEMERDLLVQRLQSGLDAKRQSSDRVGQEGKVKVNGRLSLLEKLKPNDQQKKNMCCMAVQREQGKFGWRVLATKFSKVLKLKEDVSPETARRMSQELKHQWFHLKFSCITAFNLWLKCQCTVARSNATCQCVLKNLGTP